MVRALRLFERNCCRPLAPEHGFFHSFAFFSRKWPTIDMAQVESVTSGRILESSSTSTFEDEDDN